MASLVVDDAKCVAGMGRRAYPARTSMRCPGVSSTRTYMPAQPPVVPSLFLMLWEGGWEWACHA
eukprot:8712336-Pyramimonas_sp.AAC.1